MSDPTTPPDSPPTSAVPHPTTGGKSLASFERPRYKSWRKKYRKIRANFDAAYEENRELFKEETRLNAVAKRLKEEVDGLLELCLDLNNNPSLPPELRFDVRIPNPPPRVSTQELFIDENISPEEANSRLLEYTQAVRAGRMAQVDFNETKKQIDEALALRDVERLGFLEQATSRPIDTKNNVEEDLAFLGFDQEMHYLTRLDAQLGIPRMPPAPRETATDADKYIAELTPRELERRTEFENPMSQHNWLRTHTKVLGDDADAESVASHDPSAAPKAANKRKSGAKGSLARQVGDRAVERAREGSAASVNDEDELASDVTMGGGVAAAAAAAGGKKRSKDPDGTYRVKGGKAGAAKGKRKRSGEDVGGSGGGGGKKAKVEGGAGGEE